MTILCKHLTPSSLGVAASLIATLAISTAASAQLNPLVIDFESPPPGATAGDQGVRSDGGGGVEWDVGGALSAWTTVDTGIFSPLGLSSVDTDSSNEPYVYEGTNSVWGTPAGMAGDFVLSDNTTLVGAVGNVTYGYTLQFDLSNVTDLDATARVTAIVLSFVDVGAGGVTVEARGAGSVLLDQEIEAAGNGTERDLTVTLEAPDSDIRSLRITQTDTAQSDAYWIDAIQIAWALCGNGIKEAGEGCDLQGACFADGDVNPTNTCEVCGSASNTWTGATAGKACNDALFCTDGDACDGSGSCAGAPLDCGDMLNCTTDSCDEVADSCTHTLDSGCLIDGTCRADGELDPANDCQICDSTTDDDAWNDASIGTSCDDGRFCTETSACDGSGTCGGVTERDCGDGRACTNDSCNETGRTCVNALLPYEQGGTVNWCLIGGICVQDGSLSPSNDCVVCDASTDQDNFLPLAMMASCSDGLFCTDGDACDGAGACLAGAARGCSDGKDCSADTCNEDTDRCENPVSAGCLIDNSCLMDGAANPDNACQSCEPGSSTVAWTNRPAGSTCDDGLFCTDGDACNDSGSCNAGPTRDCGDGLLCTNDSCDDGADACINTLKPFEMGAQYNWCLIADVCVDQGALDPTNDCRACDAEASQDGYLPLPVDSACNDGAFCTEGDVCDGAGSCQPGGARDCGDGFDCSDDICDEDGDRCENPVTTGCLVDSMCVPDGTLKTGNPCLVCDSNSDTRGWTAIAMDVPCDDGRFCTSDDICNGAGSCVGQTVSCDDGKDCTIDTCSDVEASCIYTIAAGCLIDGICRNGEELDPDNPCKQCDPGEQREGWTALAAGERCGDPSCSDATLQPAPTCNDSQECLDGEAMPCEDGAACATEFACSEMCSSDDECLEDFHCLDGMCTPDVGTGEACERDAACQSGFCVDNVCCDNRCDRACEACDLADSVGTCTAHPLGEDPEDDCEDPQICLAAGICANPDYPDGTTCSLDAECESGFCVDGVCCDSACDSACQSCALPNNLDTCAPYTVGEDPENECEQVCNGANACVEYEVRGNGLCSAAPGRQGSGWSFWLLTLALLALLGRSLYPASRP